MRLFRRGVPAVLVILLSVLFLKGSSINVPTGTWQSAANMSVARANAVAILVPDGRIVLAGGADATGAPVATAEAFSADGTFAALPSMSVARAQHAAIYTMTGDLLVTGGRTSGDGITNSAEIFDSLTNTWHSLSANMVEPRAGHTMSQLQNGNVLIAGGENSSGPVAALEIYDITSGQFSFAATLSTARKGHAAAVLNDGRVLIIGGTTIQSDGTSATLASTEIYDPSTGQVTAGPILATPRTNATATTLLDGRVLVLGGSYPEGANGAAPELASAEIFDPVSSTFTASASHLTTARSGHLAFLLPNNNNVLIAGGTSTQPDGTVSPLASAELYTPWTDTFAPTQSMSSARDAATGSALGNGTYIGLDGMLLIAGGTNQNSAEVYGFATVKTDTNDFFPGQTVTITGKGWIPGETVKLTLVESPLVDSPPVLYAVADANGNIFNDQFVPDVSDLNVRFYLTVLGAASTAQNTFTDAAAHNVNFATSGLPAGIALSVTNITFTNNGGQLKTNQTQGLTTPGPSQNIGTSPGTQFSYAFPATVSSAGQTYNFVGASPASPFTTGAEQSSTTVTATYQLACTAPSITTQPVGATRTVGDSVTFSVTATGTNLSYQWRKNGFPIGGATTSSYTINSVTLADAGDYDVIVSNACGSQTSTPVATLTVNKKPQTITLSALPHQIYGDPDFTISATASSGLAVTFTASGDCTVTGSNVHIVASGSCTITAHQPGDTTTWAAAPDVSQSFNIGKATPTVVVSGGPFSYDGSPHQATATATGIGNITVNGTFAFTYNGNSTPPSDAATYTVEATFTSTDPNYGNATGSGSIIINKADSTTTVTFEAGPHTYRGTAFTATAVATGAGGLNSPVTVTYDGDCTNVTVANGCTATATFAGDTNHNDSTDSKSITINKADSTTTVTFEAGPYTYRGTTFTATAVATGAGGLNSPVTVTYSGDCTNVTANNGCTATANFGGDTNHNSSTDSKSITVTPAPSTTTVTFEAGPYVYRGTAFTASAVATGVGGLNQAVTVVYSGDCTDVTSANGCTATATFAGDTNHNGSTDSKSITITPAPSTTTVTFENGPYTYRGTAFSATAVATGVGGLNQAVAVAYSGECTNVTSANGCTATANFAGDTNHQASSDTQHITITPAPSTTVVTFEAGPYTYRGTAFTATAHVTSVGVNQSLPVTYGGDCINVTVANGCTASANYAGDVNRQASSDTKAITITQASSTVAINCPASVIYTGLAQTPCTAAVTGAGGLNQSLTVNYTSNTNPGTATANASYAGDTNHSGSSNSTTFAITYGACSASIGAGSVILPPINSDGTSVYNRKGGSTIPVKFRVCAANGSSISNPAAVFAGTGGSITMLSAVRGTITDINESAGTDIPDAAFRWDSSSQQWIFNMATSNLTSGSTYAFRINLANGNIIFVVGVK